MKLIPSAEQPLVFWRYAGSKPHPDSKRTRRAKREAKLRKHLRSIRSN